MKFSVFDPEWLGWRSTNSGAFTSAHDYREHLWSAERMQMRLRIFGTWAAPHYQDMSSMHDFRVLVQYSPDLPEPFWKELRALADTYPVLRLVPTPHFEESSISVRHDLQADGRSGPVVMLRVDDDDIMSADFLTQLDPHVIPEHHGWVVSLGYGLAARTDEEGLIDFRPWVTPLIAIGQAYIGRYDARSSELDMSPLLHHRLVHRQLPTVLDSRSFAWVHVKHPWQDTRVGVDLEKARSAMLRGHHKLPTYDDDWTPVLQAFPHLRPEIERVQRQARLG
ncbi:MAG: glycosyltransferase [Ornithinimicrobium sp.]